MRSRRRNDQVSAWYGIVPYVTLLIAAPVLVVLIPRLGVQRDIGLWLGAGAIIGGTVLLTSWSRCVIPWARKRPLRRRDVLSDDEVYESFYRSSGFAKESTLELWREVARNLRVPQGLLRPSDRVRDLLIANDGLLDNAGEDLLFAAKKRAQKLGGKLPPGCLETVDDYVRSFVNVE